VWAIDEAIIHCLHVVTTCILNQSRGHWLLSNALAIVSNLIVVMEFETNPLVNGNETFDLFDVELHMLNMWQEVLKVINPLMEFLKNFDSYQIHNMLVLMLDPCFKSL
jgi:hypothetical protein